uniref:Putative chaperonin n=1 Tax=viral metagenome TaxID=1070528 RepID=A0A6M3J5H7_9ZZZZ
MDTKKTIFTPVNDYLCVKEVEMSNPDISHFIPESEKSEGQTGEVISVSEEWKTSPELFKKPGVKPGDIVLFRKYAGTKFGDYRYINYLYDAIGVIVK